MDVTDKENLLEKAKKKTESIVSFLLQTKSRLEGERTVKDRVCND